MNLKLLFFSLLAGLAIFFYPLWFKGQLPFPGHLLVSFFSPFKEAAWPGYPAGVPRKDLLGFDTVRMIYPWQSFTVKELKSGRLPLWNPHVFAGAPHLANWQSAVFFPLNWLYLILPQPIAWTILVLLQPILATSFAYLFLRSKFKPQTSTIMALAYGFSGWLMVWLQWNSLGFTYAFLPLCLYAVKLLRHPTAKNILINLISLIFLILSGHPQVSLIALTFYIASALHHRISIRILTLLISLIALITAAQWLPTAEYYLQASRESASSEFSLSRTTLPWPQLITLFAPTFFGHPATGNFWGQHNFVETTMFVGTSIFILALIGWRKSFFGWASLAILLWVLPTPLTWVLKSTSIPLISTSVISRALILLPICLIVLAASGLEKLNRARLKKLFIFTGLFILGLVAFAVLESTHTRTSLRNLAVPVAIAASTLTVLWLSLRRPLTSWLLVTVILFDLGFFAKKTLTFTEPEFIFPQVPVIDLLQSQTGFDRLGAEKASSIEANLPVYYGLSTAEGYDALYPRRVGELVWSAKENKFATDFSRSTVVVPQFENKLNQRITNLLSLKYILNQNSNLSLSDKDFTLIWQQGSWQVYQNQAALPRVKLFSRYQVIPNSQTAVETLLNPDFDYQNSLILSQPPQLKPQPATTASAQITRYTPRRVAIKTAASQPQLLLLNDTYYPGWQAKIDHQPTQIIRANHAFRAVSVPAGNHQVEFLYQPLSVKLGIFISLFGLTATIAILSRRRRI